MATRKYFGTDGIRGQVGKWPITAEFMLKLGWAAGRVLTQGGKKAASVLIGKDTRISGYMFESALEAGLVAAGVNIRLLGPMPTPAIAYLTRAMRAQAGIVISASHNLYQDNGVKFFSSEGYKLPDDVEMAIEAMCEEAMVTVEAAALGKAVRIDDAPGRYIEFCKSTVPNHTNLHGMKLLIDCANGATYHVAGDVFRELGAQVLEMNVDPDGFNINAACGSTNPALLRERVLAEKADVGIAFDGDGDRVLMVDHRGEVLDGDELLFIMAENLQRMGQLQGGVVGTLMSNLGLEQAFQARGIDFVRTSVGDRYVMEELRRRQWFLGGESSGHMIHLAETTTGDGIVAALQVLLAMRQTQKNLHELKQGMQKCPQVTRNVKVSTMALAQHALQADEVVQAIQKAEKTLAAQGRVLVRVSGTEPLLRVMVEGQEAGLVNQMVEALVSSVEKAVHRAG